MVFQESFTSHIKLYPKSKDKIKANKNMIKRGEKYFCFDDSGVEIGKNGYDDYFFYWDRLRCNFSGIYK